MSKMNEQHWLTPAEDLQRAKMNENFREVDSWEEEICYWILNYYKRELQPKNGASYKAPAKAPGFTVKQVLKGLNIQERDQRKAEQDRAANVLARIGAIRWGRKKVGRAYSRLWCVPPEVFETLCEAYYPGITINKESGEVEYQHDYLLDFIRNSGR